MRRATCLPGRSAARTSRILSAAATRSWSWTWSDHRIRLTGSLQPPGLSPVSQCILHILSIRRRRLRFAVCESRAEPVDISGV
ncbi:hypothetical protein [Novispirillum itersonii]|uniref:hypothetical protein n=1 Tax=Novispirillum itersonii TaxID=189 RepID=UPI003898F209